MNGQRCTLTLLSIAVNCCVGVQIASSQNLTDQWVEKAAGPLVENRVVDGLSVGEVGDVVLRDRRALANDGIFMIVVTVDKQTGSIVGKPEIITRGFVHLNERDPIMDEALERVVASIDTPGDHISEIALLKSQIKDGVSRYLFEQTKRRPMVFPVVVEV